MKRRETLISLNAQMKEASTEKTLDSDASDDSEEDLARPPAALHIKDACAFVPGGAPVDPPASPAPLIIHVWTQNKRRLLTRVSTPSDFSGVFHIKDGGSRGVKTRSLD